MTPTTATNVNKKQEKKMSAQGCLNYNTFVNNSQSVV